MPIRTMLWYWGRRGGAPRYTAELAKALAARSDIELHLSLSRQSDLFRETEGLGLPGWHVDTYRSPLSLVARSLRLGQLCRGLGEYIRQHDIEVVDVTMPHIWSPIVSRAIRRSGARLVVTQHELQPRSGKGSRLRSAAMRAHLRQADHVITLCQYVRDKLVTTHGISPNRVTVAEHGVFLYEGADTKSVVPRLHPGKSNPFNLLFFGRVARRKGLDLLTDAYEQLKATRPFLGLTIVGRGRARCVSRLAELEGVHVVNRWVADAEIPSIFAAANLLVLPYKKAAQSGVVTIGYGAGLPAVVTPAGGLREQVRSGETGVVADAFEAQSLAEAVATLVDDPQAYNRAAVGAVDLLRETLAWPVIADKVAAALKSALA